MFALDLLGGLNSFTLVRADLWRLVHLELGLLGFEIDLGPLQFGAGVGLSAPGASAGIGNGKPMDG